MDGSPPKGAGPGADLRQPHAEPRRPHAHVRDQRTTEVYHRDRPAARVGMLATAHVVELAHAGHLLLDPDRARADRTDVWSFADMRAARIVSAARRHPDNLEALEKRVLGLGSLDPAGDMALAARHATEIDADQAARAVRALAAASAAVMTCVGPGLHLVQPRRRHLEIALDGLAWLRKQRDRGAIDELAFGELTLRTIGQIADAIRNARRSAA